MESVYTHAFIQLLVHHHLTNCDFQVELAVHMIQAQLYAFMSMRGQYFAFEYQFANLHSGFQSFQNQLYQYTVHAGSQLAQAALFEKESKSVFSSYKVLALLTVSERFHTKSQIVCQFESLSVLFCHLYHQSIVFATKSASAESEVEGESHVR